MQMQIFVTDLVLVTMWLNPFKKNFFFGGGGCKETITVENHVIKLAGKYGGP